MQTTSIGFIGFGLIGGSIAKAMKEKRPEYAICVYNGGAGATKDYLKEALEEGVVDKVETYLDEGLCECDVIFLCAPVLTNISYLEKIKEIIKEGCIVTDVGSVKGNIHQAVKELGMGARFIGGHPMAGSEKTGYRNSSARYLENAYYLLTLTGENPPEAVALMKEMVALTGAIPIVLDATEHDEVTAAISHIPHILAASLTNMVKAHDKEGHMRAFAAGGFKDVTRIASSSPDMWRDICLGNAKGINKYLGILKDLLGQMEEALQKGDGEYLYQSFEGAKEYRDSISNKTNGLIAKTYEVYADILDETGAIATIATILASNGVSIKNVGIVHNREFEEGVLHIELYGEEEAEKTAQLLKQHNYNVYVR